MSVCSVLCDKVQNLRHGFPARRVDGLRRRWMRRGERGATLVELLTSLVVASILMVALMQSLAATTDSWTRQSKHFSAQREARVAMRMLADDLAAMVVVPSWARRPFTAPGEMTEPEATAEDERKTGFLLETAGGAFDSARLAFLRATKAAEGGGRGDLRLVMYGVVLNRDGAASGLAPAATSQKLVRREFSAAETFRRLRGLMENRTPLISEADWAALNEWRDDPAVVTTGVVAHDVIQFVARPFVDLNNPTPQLGWSPWQVPLWLDVGLRVTNRQTGQWLQTLQDWRGEGERTELLMNGTPNDFADDAEVRTYSARLMLSAFAL
jgi:hypothetical protein